MLLMAAYDMAHTGDIRALRLSRTDLAEAVASHEARRLSVLAEGHHCRPDLVCHLAACITLAQGMNSAALNLLATAEREATGRSSGGDTPDLSEVLHTALPDEGAVAPIRPDLVGEAFTLRVLKGSEGTATVLRCYKNFHDPVAETVMRCAQDGHSNENWAQACDWLEKIISQETEDSSNLLKWIERIQLNDATLVDIRRRACTQLYELGHHENDNQIVARAAQELALSLAKDGDINESISLMEESISLYKKSLTSDDTAEKMRLAKALINLSIIQNSSNNTNSALKSAKAGYEIISKTGIHNDHDPVVLILALNNLSHIFSNKSQYNESLECIKKALDTAKIFAASSSIVATDLLALCTFNYSIALLSVGKMDESIKASIEAIEYYRRLATQQPHVFRSDLARSLNHLAKGLGRMRQHKEALNAAEEAVIIYDNLSDLRPHAFKHDLASSLMTKSMILANSYRSAEALPPITEAVRILRQLKADRPNAPHYILGSALSNLSDLLCTLLQPVEALPLAREAVSIYKNATKSDKAADRFELAKANWVLAGCLAMTDNHPSALNISETALTMLLPLCRTQHSAYKNSLQSYWFLYEDLCINTGTTPDSALANAALSLLNPHSEP